jgi:ATP-binding cassette, subfamily B, bacterial PglK
MLKKILFFFNSNEKKRLAIIFFCIVMVSFIEMLGIATILPFLGVVTNPEVIHTNAYLLSVYNYLSFTELNTFIIFLGLSVFVVLVLGNIFSALTTWVMMRFCFNYGRKLSCLLLNKYLSQPYVFFLRQNTANLSKNILTEVERFVSGILVSIIQSISKILMVIFVFVLLVIVDPILAVVVITVLGGSYVIIYSMMRKKLTEAGKKASDACTVRYQLVHEMMSVVKELKILGRNEKFIDEFSVSAKEYAKAETLSQFSPLVTRYLIEAIAFGGMILIALYLIATKEDYTKFMPLLGLYALAGYRLMPAMQQLFNGLTQSRYHLSALEILYQELHLSELECFKDHEGDAIALTDKFQMKNISYTYPESNRVALKNISIDIKKFSTLGIVGASGAGKSTLIDIILGLLTPEHGELLIDGCQIDQNKIKSWRKCIGYVPQNIFLIDDTIASNIALGVKKEEIDFDAVVKAAALANIHDFVNESLPMRYNTLAGDRGVRLSGGQRQRIGIARALYHDPDILLFDEATSALDSVTEKVIMEAIKKLSHRKTIILVAHRLNTVKDCDAIYILKDGCVSAVGNYDELLQSNKIFQGLASAVSST